MAGDDVVAVEAIVISPSVEQQVWFTRAQTRAVSFQEAVVVETAHDARHAAGVEVGVLGEFLLAPPVRRVEQHRSPHARALGRKRRGRSPTCTELVRASLHRDVEILGTQRGVARQVDPVQTPHGGGLRTSRRHVRHHKHRESVAHVQRRKPLGCGGDRPGAARGLRLDHPSAPARIEYDIDATIERLRDRSAAGRRLVEEVREDARQPMGGLAFEFHSLHESAGLPMETTRTTGCLKAIDCRGAQSITQTQGTAGSEPLKPGQGRSRVAPVERCCSACKEHSSFSAGRNPARTAVDRD